MELHPFTPASDDPFFTGKCVVCGQYRMDRRYPASQQQHPDPPDDVPG